MSTIELTESITITDGARSVVQDLLVQKNVPDYGLRIFVSGGGCSGMQYGMALDAEPGENDVVIDGDGVKIFVANGLADNTAMAAEKSNLFFGTGLLADHNEVKVIDNPNAVSSCGCGNSFKTSANSGATGYTGGGGCGCG